MKHTGSCLCGAVTFEVQGDLPAPSACHCSKCRKHSGHFEASTDLPRSAVTVYGSDKVTWYHSSEKVRRGFYPPPISLTVGAVATRKSLGSPWSLSS